jgi:cation diffusion facilitator family transporter
LLATALVQVVVVALSGSVALLADTIHNFADSATALPLGLAFWLARRTATRRFTYGLGRVEDLAGIAIVVTILASAFMAAYQAVGRLLHPPAGRDARRGHRASIIGFPGNEAVAVFRIRVGRQIEERGARRRWLSRASTAEPASRSDRGARVWAGPLADPVVGP